MILAGVFQAFNEISIFVVIATPGNWKCRKILLRTRIAVAILVSGGSLSPISCHPNRHSVSYNVFGIGSTFHHLRAEIIMIKYLAVACSEVNFTFQSLRWQARPLFLFPHTYSITVKWWHLIGYQCSRRNCRKSNIRLVWKDRDGK